MELSIGKWYRTRAGRKVIIYALNGSSPYTTHGAILWDNGWVQQNWNEYGHAIINTAGGDDIIGVWKEPVPLFPLTPGPYLTRDGRMATIYHVADRGTYPVYGAVFGEHGCGLACIWDRQGKSDIQDSYDLAEPL